MVKFFTVIQIIFAEKFVSQDFTIRTAPGLSGPKNTCAIGIPIQADLALCNFTPSDFDLGNSALYKSLPWVISLNVVNIVLLQK